MVSANEGIWLEDVADADADVGTAVPEKRAVEKAMVSYCGSGFESVS
jgi:hypothetical protein